MSRRLSRVVFAAGSSALLSSSLAIAGTTMATSTTEPEPGAVQIVPPDESFAGATLGEWGARWFQWFVSLPEDINPGSETTGEACGYGQDGPVFFTPYPSADATWNSFSYDCVVPEGAAIYVPRWVFDCSSVEAPPW